MLLLSASNNNYSAHTSQQRNVQVRYKLDVYKRVIIPAYIPLYIGFELNSLRERPHLVVARHLCPSTFVIRNSGCDNHAECHIFFFLFESCCPTSAKRNGDSFHGFPGNTFDRCLWRLRNTVNLQFENQPKILGKLGNIHNPNIFRFADAYARLSFFSVD